MRKNTKEFGNVEIAAQNVTQESTRKSTLNTIYLLSYMNTAKLSHGILGEISDFTMAQVVSSNSN